MHVAGEYAMGGFSVTFDWSGRLRMAHFNQGCAYGNILLAVEEDSTGFSFGGGCHDGVYGLALGENQSIWRGLVQLGGGGGVSLR